MEEDDDGFLFEKSLSPLTPSLTGQPKRLGSVVDALEVTNRCAGELRMLCKRHQPLCTPPSFPETLCTPSSFPETLLHSGEGRHWKQSMTVARCNRNFDIGSGQCHRSRGSQRVFAIKIEACFWFRHRNVFCLEHQSYKSHECPKSDHNSRKVLVCGICSTSIEITGHDDEKVLLEKHRNSGRCDHANKKKPTYPVMRCKQVLTFSNTSTCKTCQLKVCLKHRWVNSSNY